MSLQIWMPLTDNNNNQGLFPMNSPSWNTLITQTDGKLGKCRSGQAIFHIDNEILGNSWTLCAWVKSAGWPQTSNDIILCKNISESTSTQFYLSIMNGRAFNLGINGNYTAVTYAYMFATNTWYHVAATYDGSTYGLYINGELKKTGSYTSSQKTGMNNIGINCRSGNAAGTTQIGDAGKKLNDVRIYDNALSAQEIANIAKGLVLWYPLNDRRVEATTNLVTTTDGLSSSCYNGATNKYSYGTTTDMYKTYGNFQGKNCTKVYMGTAGLSAYPYVYIDAFGTTGTTIHTLSFDYYPTKQTSIIPYSYNGTYNWTWNNGNQYGTSNNISAITIPVTINTWNHIIITIQKYNTNDTNRGNGYIRIGSSAHTSTTTDYWLFANIQVEAKNHATAYAGVGGTRTPTTVYDCSGFGNNGTIVGTLKTTTPGPRYNHTTKFDGNTSCIKIPYNEINPDKIFTVNLWFYKDALGSKNYETLFGGPAGFEMDTRAGAATALSLYMASTRGGTLFSPLNLDQWYMVTMVRDGTNEMYYINGELKKTIEAKPMPSGQYRIGAWNSDTSQNYYGDISDFQIYATALSADDIQELYRTSKLISGTTRTARDLI